MDLQELAKLVQKMRNAQKRYFRNREDDVLIEAKNLERIVDNEVYDILAGQRDLFEDDKNV